MDKEFLDNFYKFIITLLPSESVILENNVNYISDKSQLEKNTNLPRLEWSIVNSARDDKMLAGNLVGGFGVKSFEIANSMCIVYYKTTAEADNFRVSILSALGGLYQVDGNCYALQYTLQSLDKFEDFKIEERKFKNLQMNFSFLGVKQVKTHDFIPINVNINSSNVIVK